MGRCPTGADIVGPDGGGRKKGLQTALKTDILQEIEAFLGRQSIEGLDFEAVEIAVRRQALCLAARALEPRLNADTSDYAGPELPCPCGEPARYHGRHGKTFESVLGPLFLKRAYYDCGRCHQGFCPRDRALKLESFSLTPGVLRMTASAAALVSFEESSGLLHEWAWKSVSSRWNGPPKRWGRRSPWMNARTLQGCAKWPPPCIWAWMAPGCPCARKKSQTARASKPTARRKLARPSWSLSGRRNREIGKANPCAIQDRSAIRVRLKAPPLRIPVPTCRILPRAYSARPAAAVSPKPCVRWCWAMARPGFGTRLPNCSRQPLRFSIAFMPKNISAKWERSFMETAPRARHGSMHVVTSLTKVT